MGRLSEPQAVGGAFLLRRMTKEDVGSVAAIEAACFSDVWSERLVAELPESEFDETWILEKSGAEEFFPMTDEESATSGSLPAGLEADTSEARPGRRFPQAALVPVGYITFRFLAGEGELMRIAVLPECRGRGLSRLLMERLDRSAADRGVPDITLEARASNVPALRLYAAFGFREEARRKRYYHNPEEDAVILWRRDFPAIHT